MSIKVTNPDSLDLESQQAAGDLEDLLFGGLMQEDVMTEEAEEEAEDEDVTDKVIDEALADEEDKALKDEEEEEAEEEEGEEGEDDPKADADLDAYLEPLADYIPEGTEIKTMDDYKKFMSEFTEKYKDNETKLNEEVEANQMLVDIFEAHPELASLARTLAKSKDITFQQALRDIVDPEDIVPDKATDPEGYADYMLAKKEKEREAQRQKETFDKNIADSDKVIAEFQQSNDFEQSTIDTIMSKAQSFLGDIQQGRITKEFLQVLAKGMNYDVAVTEAAQKGKVEGKNEAANKARQRRKGDGLPKPKNASGGKTSDAPKGSPLGFVDDAIERAADPFKW